VITLYSIHEQQTNKLGGNKQTESHDVKLHVAIFGQNQEKDKSSAAQRSMPN